MINENISQSLRGRIAIFTLALVYCSSVLAKEKGPGKNEPQAFSMGEIVVTARREVPPMATVYEITAKEIESRNAQTVAEALDFVPGVWVTVGQKNEPDVMLRGFEQGKLLVLLDGVPIASPYYGKVDLGQIPVENIAKIKVIKGPVSPLYGCNALGGVINIITKQPGKKPRLNLSSSFSNGHTNHYAVNWGMKAKEFSLWLSGSHRKSDGFRLSKAFRPTVNEDGGLRENSDYQKNSLSLKLTANPDEKHTTALSLHYLDNQTGIPPHISNSHPRYWRFTTWKWGSAVLASESHLSDAISVKERTFYNKYDNILKSYHDATYTTVDWTSTYNDYTLGSSLYLNLNPENGHSFTVGVNLKRDVHKEREDKGEPWKRYETGTYSFSIEDRFRVAKRISLLTSVSYGLFDKRKTYRTRTGGDVQTFDWLLAVACSFQPGISLHGSLSRKTRFPTMHQLYSSRSGNPDLKEQSNINYELGLRYTLEKRIRGELSYFHNGVKNLIARAGKGEPYLNTRSVTIRGMETDLYTEPTRYLSLRIAYTWLDARDRNPELLGRSEHELPLVPHHKFELAARSSLSSGFSGNLLGSYIGKRCYYDKDNAQHQLESYWLWKAKVSQQIKRHWEVSLTVDNLFDTNYQEEEGYPQPGRTISLGLAFRLASTQP